MPRLRLALVAACLALGSLLLALPSAAGAAVFDFEGSFGSGLSVTGRFAEPAGVAVDDAGRVYVADTARGTVEVYDSYSSDNRFLGQIGVGVISGPVGVTVDNRGRIYVADAGRNVVTIFEQFQDNARKRADVGGEGTGIGNTNNPRFVYSDVENRIYVTERENVRVQFFKPSGGRDNPIAAFGVSFPETFDDPEGITLDANNRVYVSDASPGDGQLRVFDRRGGLLREIASPGAGPSQVSAPRGLLRDPAGRIVVADSGNNRIQLFSPFPQRNQLIDLFGSQGSGPGEFRSPADVAVAPGARMYVSDPGNGRIVRLRYDDADRDGVIDARDNCRGLPNPDQRDSNRNKVGNACDPDDDGDGVLDASDRCPLTRRGPDPDRDGCGARDVQPASGRQAQGKKRKGRAWYLWAP